MIRISKYPNIRDSSNYNFDVTKENIKEHSPNWPQISDHPYWILVIGDFGSAKTNLLFNLISHYPGIDKKKNICETSILSKISNTN